MGEEQAYVVADITPRNKFDDQMRHIILFFFLLQRGLNARKGNN
jgi:hypothetical protein